jgi:predicted dehydrogenase
MESYRRQARRFLAWIAGAAEPPVDGSTGLASLELADQIRAKASG